MLYRVLLSVEQGGSGQPAVGRSERGGRRERRADGGGPPVLVDCACLALDHGADGGGGIPGGLASFAACSLTQPGRGSTLDPPPGRRPLPAHPTRSP